MGISKIKTSLIIAFSIVTDSSATLAETLAALRENSIIEHTTFEVPAHLNSELSAFLRSEGSSVKNYFNKLPLSQKIDQLGTHVPHEFQRHQDLLAWHSEQPGQTHL